MPGSFCGHGTLVAALGACEVQPTRVLFDDRDVRLLGDQHRAARMRAPGGDDPLERVRVRLDPVLGERAESPSCHSCVVIGDRS